MDVRLGAPEAQDDRDGDGRAIAAIATVGSAPTGWPIVVDAVAAPTALRASVPGGRR